MDIESARRAVFTVLMNDPLLREPVFRPDITSLEDIPTKRDIPLLYVWVNHRGDVSISVNGNVVQDLTKKLVGAGDPAVPKIRDLVMEDLNRTAVPATAEAMRVLMDEFPDAQPLSLLAAAFGPKAGTDGDGPCDVASTNRAQPMGFVKGVFNKATTWLNR